MRETQPNIGARRGIMASPVAHMLLILLLALVAYSNSFGVPFHYDGIRLVADNPMVRDVGHFTDPTVWTEMPFETKLLKTRYTGFLTFALNYRFGGLNVTGYHAVNLAIHFFTALLVYWLVLLTFRTPALKESSIRGHAKYIALGAAVLFTVHPIQTQAVTYIYQRLASLVTMLYLLSLVSYIGFRFADRTATRVPFYLLCLLSAVLAMETKQNAFTLPVVIALYELIFFEGNIKKRTLWLVPIMLTMLIIPLSLMAIKSQMRGTMEVSRWQYLFTEPRVLVTYLRMMLLPVGQSLEHGYRIYSTPLIPQVLVSLLMLLGLFAFGVRLLYRPRGERSHLRLVGFGIVWFFITIAIESSVFPLENVIYEHRLYLPGVGVLVAASVVTAMALSGLGSARLRSGAVALLASLAVVLGAATYARNTVWQSELSLWRDVVKKAPDKAMGHNNLCNAYGLTGQYDEAIEQCELAIELDPDYTDAYNNIGSLYKDKGVFDKAESYFLQALDINPASSLAHYNLGSLYGETGKLDPAIEHLEEAKRRNPGHDMARNNLGIAYMLKGDLQRAIENYREAIALRPDNFEAHYNLALAYKQKGLNEKAAEELRIAERLRSEGH